MITTIDPRSRPRRRRRSGTCPEPSWPSTRHGRRARDVANPTRPERRSRHRRDKARRPRRAAERRPGEAAALPGVQELFPPGSTFKLVTAAAALRERDGPGSQLSDNPPSLDLPQTNARPRELRRGALPRRGLAAPLAQALRVSCNVVFGEVGLRLGAAKLVDQAQKFGFDQHIPFDLPLAEGSIPQAKDFADALPAVASRRSVSRASGRTPCRWPWSAAAIANGGVEMAPKVVSEIRDPSGRVVKTIRPSEFGRPISPKNRGRAHIDDGERGRCRHGHGRPGPRGQVAGKTGTAQHGEGGAPHAWFVSFAPADAPTIAVAVIVLDGGSLGSEATGGQVAAPIAKAVLEAALGR